MNPFSIPPILSSLLFLALGGFVYLKNRKSIINLTFLLVCLTTFWWQFSWFFLFNIEDQTLAAILVKIGYIGILLLPATFLHFSLALLGKLDKFNKRILYLSYLITAFFEASLMTNFLIDGYYEYFWGFYPKASFLHPFFLLFIGLIVVRAVYLLISSIKKETGFTAKRFQIEYILVAIIFYTLASIDFSVNYGFEFYPIGFIFILIFLAIVGYAIAKYRLMNIRIILAEFLVVLIAFVLLTQFLLSETVFEYIWKGALLLIFLFLGYQLIKSVLREIKRRAELQRLYEEVEKLSNAKSEFISIVSHQLRTPLSVTKGYISMILEGDYEKLPRKIKTPLENIYNSNERLIKLINDLLDVSRIESGKIEMNFEKTSLNKFVEMISSVVDELKIKAKSKNLYLTWEKPATKLSKTYLKLDQNKTRQTILNLVDNAIRYTRRGGINIKVKLLQSAVQMQVKDTGIGMEKEEITSLFKSFTRGAAGSQLSPEGLGLGLYVAKKFVEMHQGKIWAESQGKGKGSTFYIELPLL